MQQRGSEAPRGAPQPPYGIPRTGSGMGPFATPGNFRLDATSSSTDGPNPAKADGSSEGGASSAQEKQTLLHHLEEQRANVIQKLKRLAAISPSLRIFPAVHSGSVSRMQVLLANGIVSVFERDYNGSTPLHVAASTGDDEMVCLLLSFKSDVGALDAKGRTARDIAHLNGHSYVARILDAAARFTAAMSPSVLPTSTQTDPDSTPHPDDGGDSSRIGSGQEYPVSSPPLAIVPSALVHHLRRASDIEQGLVSQCAEDSTTQQQGALLATSYRPSRFSTISDTVPVIICMVGLPGRGKSFISNHIRRYLNWKGVPCQVFNAGNYRRRLLGASNTGAADFFGDNPDTVALREHMAELACDDVAKFVKEAPGVSVAVLDATNTTIDRRSKLVNFFASATPGARLLFIESVCNSQDVVRENILRAKFGGDDFQGISDPNAVLDDFYKRIANYEKRYESISATKEHKLSFIRIIDVKETVELHRVEGVISARAAFFLLNLHPVAFPIYVCRHGETDGDANEIFGGDESLTSSGRLFSEALKSFAAERSLGTETLTVLYAGNSGATKETVAPLLAAKAARAELNLTFDAEPRGLGDVNYGTFSLSTRASAAREHPRTFNRLFGKPVPVSRCTTEGLDRIDPSPKAAAVVSSLPEMTVFTPEDVSASPTPALRRLLTPNVMPSLSNSVPDDVMTPAQEQLQCLKYPSYNAVFPRGESTRMVAVRLEDVILRISRTAGPLLIVCPDTPARVLLCYLADMLPEQTQHIRLPLHSIVEISPKGDMTVNSLLVASPMSAAQT